jgi:GT2 family glycosyltransferase
MQRVLQSTHPAVVTPIVETSLVYRPVVISIVTYNQAGLLESALRSLYRLTRYPCFKVVVTSNGCVDGTPQMLRKLQEEYPSLSVILNESNSYFVLPNNEVIKAYPESDIVLLNNDIRILDPDWLLNLYHAAYSAPWIGAAGGTILDTDGKLLEAGAELMEDGSGRNLGRGDDPATSGFSRPRNVGYVSGCLLYMRRDALDRFGPLDEDFHPMYCEDAAWQYSMHMHGVHSKYTPLCRIEHMEGASAGREIGSGMKMFQEINRRKLLRKFQGHSLTSISQTPVKPVQVIGDEHL